MSASQGQQGAEIGVRGHDGGAVVGSSTQDHLVVGTAQSDRSDMDGIVPGTTKDRSDPDREVLVDQQLHPAAVSGISRSRV